MRQDVRSVMVSCPESLYFDNRRSSLSSFTIGILLVLVLVVLLVRANEGVVVRPLRVTLLRVGLWFRALLILSGLC